MDCVGAVEISEPALVTRAVAEPADFAAVYDHYFPKVWNYVRYRVRGSHAADDVTSRVFERALAGLGSYDPGKGSFGGWLFSIARNCVNDHHRSVARRRWLPLEALRHRADESDGPEALAEWSETKRELVAAIEKLNDRERDLLGLKFGGGLTNKRISELTGLSESNVGVILYRALRRLKARLTGGGDGGG